MASGRLPQLVGMCDHQVKALQRTALASPVRLTPLAVSRCELLISHHLVRWASVLQMIRSGMLLLGNHDGGALLLWRSERRTSSRSGYVASFLMSFQSLVRGCGVALRTLVARWRLWLVPNVILVWLPLLTLHAISAGVASESSGIGEQQLLARSLRRLRLMPAALALVLISLAVCCRLRVMKAGI